MTSVEWSDEPRQRAATGWFALCVGIAFTSGVAAALMALVFYGGRKAYDEEAYRASRPDFRR